jgi:hypothetical protein
VSLLFFELRKLKYLKYKICKKLNPQKYAKMSEIDLIIGNDKKSDIASYDLNSAVNFKENDFQINSQDPNNHADQLFFESQKKSLNFLDQNQEAKIRVNNIMSVKSTAPQLVSYFENQTRVAFGGNVAIAVGMLAWA